MNCVVLTGGGTAGHVMPALALVPYLRPFFGKIAYVGQTNGVEQRLAAKYGLPFFGTQTIKFDRTHWKNNLAIPRVLHIASNQVASYLQSLQCDVVFSKGGYCALPTVLAAHRLGIPIVCHESDYTMGLANRVSRLYTRHMITSFADTKHGLFVGNPIRDEILHGQAAHCPPFDLPRPVVLVMGGSMGAKALNDSLAQAMPLLTAYNIINLCGSSPTDYRAPNFRAVPFVDNIQDYLSFADVVVCRAGANTLFELAALGKPTVMVPLPKGNSRGDQVQNALYFEREYGFVYLPQQQLTPVTLAAAIQTAAANPPVAHPYTPCNAALAQYIAQVAKGK